jgi:carboxymethylenebutenolidase
MTTHTLKSAHDGFAMPAYHAAPNGAPRGGVVVIQEIFGVTPHVEDIARRFADAGYVAIAPALFERVEPGFQANVDADGIAKGRNAVGATSWAQVAADVQTAIQALPQPCYVTGFCWGGAATWLAAAQCTGLKAASSFYGRSIIDLLDTPPRIPIMLHYGARDASIPPDNIERVRLAAPDAPLYLYDAGHGFCRDGSHDFNEAARNLALKRTLDWFARWR